MRLCDSLEGFSIADSSLLLAFASLPFPRTRTDPPRRSHTWPAPPAPADEFVKGFQVFDKEGRGRIGAGELRYVLTQLGEKMTDEEVDELLKGFPVV